MIPIQTIVRFKADSLNESLFDGFSNVFTHCFRLGIQEELLGTKGSTSGECVSSLKMCPGTEF